MNKKMAFLLIGLLLAIAFNAGAQTPAVGEWQPYDDSFSTITVTQATETIGGKQVTTYTIAGRINRGGEYPYAGVTFRPDETTLNALRRGRGFSFKVAGDGRQYFVEVPIPEVKDWAHFSTQITPGRNESTINVIYNALRQPDWGTKVTFNRGTVECFNLGINVLGAFSIKVYDVQVLN